MRVTHGRVFAKVGAEGVYCAGVPGAELGVALKVEDGATRAAEPALIATLKALAILAARLFCWQAISTVVSTSSGVAPTFNAPRRCEYNC